MRPACLVLDEPTAMLDLAGRRELLETLQRLNRTQGDNSGAGHPLHGRSGPGRAGLSSWRRGKSPLDGLPEEVFARARQLEELGLELPAPAEIARGLKRRGLFHARRPPLRP